MIDGGKLRRATLFALLFGGGMGFVVWLAGGLGTKSPQQRHDASASDAPSLPGETAPIGPKISVGVSTDASLARDAVKVIDGKPVRYRSWTVAWRRATPKKSAVPEVGVQDVELPHVTMYPDPQSASSPPLDEGAAGTTRITSKTGVLEYEKDVRTRVHLVGDVAFDRFDPQSGDFRLRAPTLDCTMESAGAVEKRHARTSDPVTIDGHGSHLEGTGLEADLVGAECRASLLSAVKGRFESRAGSLTQAGGGADAPSAPTDVTCSGACDLVALDANVRGTNRRWRATFHDDVHVVQGDDSLDCDVLEVEFRMGEAPSKSAPPPQRVVATGHVRVKGRTAANAFTVTSDSATHRQEGPLGKEVDIVVFEGSPVLNVFGRVGETAKPGQAPATRPDSKGRLEIRCDNPVTMTTQRTGNMPTSPYRTNVVFEKNVVAKQWDDEKAESPTGELRASKATLYGSRPANDRFQPEYMTAEGGVDLKRLEFTSHSGQATWERLAEQGIDRYMLATSPVVNYVGVGALRPFGKAKATSNAKIVAESADAMQIDVYEERKPEPGKPVRPYAVITGGPKAVITQFADGAEVSRMTADRVDAIIAQGRQLETAAGTGGAHLWGLDAQGVQRDVFGARVTLDELVLPPGAPKNAPHPARVTSVGDKTTSALAVVREKDGSRHDVRARSLRYDEAGGVITATNEVVINIDTRSRGASGSTVAKAADGAVRITANEARMELAPSTDEPQQKRRLRKVTAKGDVVVDATLNRIEGDEVVYDAVTGIAEVRGKEARVVNTSESARYTSFVKGELIRAYVDVSDDPAKNGRLLRSSLPDGGMIVRYLDPPDAETGRPTSDKAPKRMVIMSKGPIEATRTEATAVDDVRASVWGLAPSGDWTVPGPVVYCDRAHMTFDADAPGPSKDRLHSLEATGADGRQVQIDTPEFHARADRVEVDALKHLLRMSTMSGKDVYVRQLDTGRQFLYDDATYDYETRETTGTRMREIESPPPPSPQTPLPAPTTAPERK